MESWVPIVLFLVIGLVLCMFFFFRHRARQEIQHTLRLAMENGRELSPELLAAMSTDFIGGRRDLRRGVVSLALAAAIAVCAWVLDEAELLGIAAFPLMLGIAYLGLWRFDPESACLIGSGLNGSGPSAGSLNGDPTSAASDEVLVARVVTLADTGAFETLMRRHQQRIYYLHKRFSRSPSLAEELSQETFLRAWRKLASFQGRGSFGGWLTRLAYNVFLQHRRRHPDDGRTDSLDDPGTLSEQALATSPSFEGGADLDRLLAVVSADEQRVLILTYAAGLSTTEIGDMLNVPAGTVKSRIHRAKQKIREHFHLEETR